MYEEYIKVLEGLNEDTLSRGAAATALRAAVKLMKAAQPLDSTAEREHCVVTAKRARSPYHHVMWTDMDPLSEAFMYERAAARAEGFEAVQLDVANHNHKTEERRADAAQAEIERQQMHVAEFQRLGQELETKLTAAQVEIAQVRAERRLSAESYELLRTKLTAAQAEIERRDRGFEDQCQRLMDQADHAHEELLAAQAEIERWKHAYSGLAHRLADREHAESAELRTKLTAAQAEIERRKL